MWYQHLKTDTSKEFYSKDERSTSTFRVDIKKIKTEKKNGCAEMFGLNLKWRDISM
jgi:hypothetical protein